MSSREPRYERSPWGSTDQDSIARLRLLVVGAGTTGNEVIKNISLLGVGNIDIVDNDKIEQVNLDRCLLFCEEDIGKNKAVVACERSEALNPRVKATPITDNLMYALEYSSSKSMIG